jgi:hypothetical protein
VDQIFIHRGDLRKGLVLSKAEGRRDPKEKFGSKKPVALGVRNTGDCLFRLG